MKKYSVVKLTDSFKQAMAPKPEHPILQEDSFIFYGEIPDMDGQCIVTGQTTGKVYSGFLKKNFEPVLKEGPEGTTGHIPHRFRPK